MIFEINENEELMTKVKMTTLVVGDQTHINLSFVWQI